MSTNMLPTEPVKEVAASDFALDTRKESLGSFFTNYLARLRGGELGALPASLSVIALAVVFTYATYHKPGKFLSLFNGANLIQQAAAVIMISVGVTFVLLLGEIDLAAGWTAGVAAGALAISLQHGQPLIVAAAFSFGAAMILGLFTGYMVAKVGIPSFVVTLANFLIFQGFLLLITGNAGTVQIGNKVVLSIMRNNTKTIGSWALAALVVLGFGGAQFIKANRDPDGYPMSVAVLKSLGIAILVGVATVVFDRDRGFVKSGDLVGFPIVVPVVLIVIIALTALLTRTAYGRHLYAVGGNTEAARRAGINITLIRLSAFTMCALVAGFGGWLLAARPGSVDPQMGGNDTLLRAVGAAVIGGTSLFGGRGRLSNALLGGLALAMIDNGLPLVGKATPFGLYKIDFSNSGIRYIVSGLFLFLAASLDALSRKRASTS